MTLKIGSGKNEAPTAQDSDFETYKNIAAPVPLSIQDPENDELTVTIVSQPKRGTVEVSDDGTVTYTPTENKVGKDSFTYTVTDTAGNVSEEATVRTVSYTHLNSYHRKRHRCTVPLQCGYLCEGYVFGRRTGGHRSNAGELPHRYRNHCAAGAA